MIIIRNYDDMLLERYGYNNIAKEISNKIIDLINYNLGKLILNKSITLNSSLGKISEIDFIEDIINIKLSNRTYGNVNPKSTINESDSIYNMTINLELILSPIELKAKRLIHNDIIHTVEHESLHIIEGYLTNLNNKSFAKSWDMGSELQDLQNKYKLDDNWQEISHFIYLSLPHEMRARLQQLNSKIKMMGLRGIYYVQGYIKRTKIFKDVEFLSEIDEIVTLNKLKKDKNYNDIIKDFSLLFLKNSGIDYENNFKDYFKTIKFKNKKILSKLLKTSYNFESYGHEDIIIDYSKYIK